MLLQINPKKTTPPNTISTHRHILTIVILGQTTQIFAKSKTKKSSPGGLLCLVSRYNAILRAVQRVAA